VASIWMPLKIFFSRDRSATTGYPLASTISASKADTRHDDEK